MKLQHLFCTALISFIATSSQSAMAGNWNVDVDLQQSAAFQSNPMMLISDVKEIFGSVTTPTVTLSSKTPTTSIRFKNSVTQNLFNETEFSSTDFHSDLNVSKKIERWEAGVDFGFDYDTTRTSELTTFGRDTINDHHTGFDVAPTFSFHPNKANSLTLSGQYLLSRYKDGRNHTDYNIYASSFSWGRVLSEFSTGYLSVNARRYAAQTSSDQMVDSIGPSIGWRMKASEHLTTMLTVGSEVSRQRESNGADNNKWTWNSVFAASLNYKDEQHNLTLKASRQQQPYSNNSSSLLTSFGVNEAYKFNELLTGSLGGNYQHAKQSSLSTSNLKSRITADTSLGYKLTEKLGFKASYKYKNEKLRHTSSSQVDNAVFLRLTYKPTF